MEVTIEVTEEHADGSATCKVDMDKEALEVLLEKGIIAILTEYIGQQKDEYADKEKQ